MLCLRNRLGHEPKTIVCLFINLKKYINTVNHEASKVIQIQGASAGGTEVVTRLDIRAMLGEGSLPYETHPSRS